MSQHVLVGIDEPTTDVLRRADVRSGLVHGTERRDSAQVLGREGKDRHLHHPPAVVRSLLHVRQDPPDGRGQSGFPGHARAGYRLLQNVSWSPSCSSASEEVFDRV